MKLYDYLPSGNSYKVRLLLSWLGETYEHIPVDIHKGETHTPEFLALNPAGQMPLLVLDDGRTIAESGAILYYLALGTDYFPPDAYAQSQILRWMLFEQNRHEPNIAGARFVTMYAPERKDELPGKHAKGHEALAVMETHLQDNDYFAADKLTIADIALYAYTHVAEEGGIALKHYPAIRRWLKRVEAHPKHIKITAEPKRA
jgi:glutathione S-transferase